MFNILQTEFEVAIMWLHTVNILPEAQKKTKFAIRGKYPHAYDPSKKYKEQIIWQVKPYAPTKIMEGPVELELYFHMPIPKAASMIRRKQMIAGIIHHIKRPDIDNLAYVVTNALKGLVYKDDSQIVNLHVYKRYADAPKILLKVIDINEETRKQCYDYNR